jgi:hypothetical protein
MNLKVGLRFAVALQLDSFKHALSIDKKAED